MQSCLINIQISSSTELIKSKKKSKLHSNLVITQEMHCQLTHDQLLK